MTLRPELALIVDGIVHRLAARSATTIGLDEIGDAIGATAISIDEIELVFTTLEERGITVGDATIPPASAHLGDVLKTARALRSELGRTPRPDEIAQRAGLAPEAVRRALFAARILQR